MNTPGILMLSILQYEGRRRQDSSAQATALSAQNHLTLKARAGVPRNSWNATPIQVKSKE
jgi:hypothetical protein